MDGIALSLPGFIDAEQGVVKGGGALSLAYNVARLSAPGWPRPAAAGSGSRMTVKRLPLRSWSGAR